MGDIFYDEKGRIYNGIVCLLAMETPERLVEAPPGWSL